MRYKKTVRESIDKAIHDATMMGLTIEQSIQFVLEKTGIKIGHCQIVDRKRLLRNNGIAIWNKYRKDDYAYRLKHLDRMHEVERVKEQAYEKMMEYKDDPKRFFQWKYSAYTVLESVRLLSELHAAIPEIDAIGHEMEQEIPEIQSTEQGSMVPQTGRKF